MLGLVRVCSNAPLFDGSPLEPAEAWSVFQRWMGLEEIVYLTEAPGCRHALDGMVATGVITRRVWTDAYLAAFAMAGGLRLVSFDRDFDRFQGLPFLHLEP